MDETNTRKTKEKSSMISAQEYRQRRMRLAKELGRGVIAIIP